MARGPNTDNRLSRGVVFVNLAAIFDVTTELRCNKMEHFPWRLVVKVTHDDTLLWNEKNCH
jgi:hypothetical protein